MKKHILAGGVLWNPTQNKFYLIYKKERDEWSLPKGHINENEKLEDTAVREVREETGYQNIELMGDNAFLGKIEYQYENEKGKKNSKIVRYYLMRLNADIFNETPERKEEGLTGGWFGFKEAMDLIAFEDVRKILSNVKNNLMR